MPAAKPGAAKNARFMPANFDQLNFLLGCWKGRRDDGRESVLRFTREGNVITMATGIACETAIPLLAIYFSDGAVGAAEARESGQFVYHGMALHWTARTVTTEQLVLAPDFAPTWERFKLLAPGQLEWSSAPASGSAKPSAFVLTRMAENP